MASDRVWGNRDNKIVILDSSSLMMLFEFSIDLEDELRRLIGIFHIVVPRGIVDELSFLSKHGKGKKQRIAKPALDLALKYEVIEGEGNEIGDDAVLRLAKKTKGFVVTNDSELKKRLKEIPVPVICLRGKKTLIMG